MTKEQLYYFLSSIKQSKFDPEINFKVPWQKKFGSQYLMDFCDLTIKGKNKKLLSLNKLLTNQILSRSHNLYFYLDKTKKLNLECNKDRELIIPFNLHQKYFKENKNIQKLVSELNNIYNYNFCKIFYAQN